MNKILLIISREYLTRVKKRSFIVLTFLVPLLIAAMYAVIIYIVFNQNELSNSKKVTVIDESGTFKNRFKNKDNLLYYYSDKSFAEAKKSLRATGSDYILYIPAFQNNQPQGIQLVSEKQANFATIRKIDDAMDDILRTKRLLAAGIDTSRLNQIKQNISIETRLLTTSGEKNSNSYAAYGIGFLFSFLIYLFIFLYGAQVMRGVIEEKTSRVIEVIISSVKPFQLMMGKIVGIALVGLTQFLLWVVLSTFVTSLMATQFSSRGMITKTTGGVPGSMNVNVPSGQASNIRDGAQVDGRQVKNKEADSPAKTFLNAMNTLNFPYLLGCFLFYFITGYLLYGALFAAIGSAVDSETETQQFMMPVTLPLVFGFVISVNYVVNFPDSNLSIWLSMVPFFAPVVMMVRLPFNPPAWEIALSMTLMVLGFLGTVWLAARIYRTGILMYGKKTNFKELGKWLFYKG